MSQKLEYGDRCLACFAGVIVFKNQKQKSVYLS